MAGLIKLILTLILISGAALYGGDIWNTKAPIFDSLKNGFDKAGNLAKEAKEKLANIDLEQQKSKIEERFKESIETAEKTKGKLENTKDKLEEIKENKNSGAALIQKTFENLKDLKEGVRNLFSNPCL
ncbi:MAG: hypothetical protein AAB469_00660 [Patescibacteria group bacterium]